MEDNVQSARQKAASLALFLFAFVGFIASIVAVATYFQPKDTGVLHVDITPNDFQVPLEVSQPFAEGAPARKLAADVKAMFCERAKKSSKPAKQESESETQDQSAPSELCDQAGDLDWAARWTNAWDTAGTLYRYDIENRGAAVAQKIRIAGKGVASLQLQRGDKFADIQPDKGEDFYDLPDLNPHEKATVLIWTTGQGNEFLGYDDAPSVTFSGASVSKQLYRRVPDSWASIYDSFGDMPTILLIAVLIGLSIIVTLAVVLVVSIIAALVSGKPLRTVFETPKAEAGPPAEEATT